jgi:hypothetical protein
MLSTLIGGVDSRSRAVGVSVLALVGCGGVSPNDSFAPLGQTGQPFVNGGDDRVEYFELAEPFQRAALEQFTVALMTRGTADELVHGHVGALRTWGEINRLCEGEPFEDQPVAAFCSGVLVDHDLVLTSGHCVNLPPPFDALEELRVVFDYYYRDVGELALSEEDVYELESVITSRRDEETLDDAGERLDFAWLQLKGGAHPPHHPARIHTRQRGANPNDRVISIGAGGGVPMKWDEGGRVQGIRPDYDDYLIADTDTSQGSSGGGIFDANLALLGNLARGAPDFERTAAGCFVTSTESDPAAAREQFTYAHRAVEALCAAGSDSVLCDETCGDPCDAGALAPASAEEDVAQDLTCTLTRGATSSGGQITTALLFATTALSLRRHRRTAGRRPSESA